MTHEPLGVVAGEGLAHVPAGLHENRLEGMHGDAVVGAMPAGVHIVVAAPVLVVPPVNALQQPGAPTSGGSATCKSVHSKHLEGIE